MPRSLALFLGALAPLLALPGHAAPFCKGPTGSTSALDVVLPRHVEQRLGSIPVADIGPLAQSLGDELRTELCADPALAGALPNTCGPGSFALETLRANLVIDLLTLPRGALGNRLATLEPGERVAVAFLAALSHGVEPAEVAHRVALTLGYTTTEECLPPQVSPADAVGLAVAVVWTVTQPDPSANERTQEQTEALVAQTLATLRGGTPLRAVELELAREVARQTLASSGWWRTLQRDPANQEALVQLLLAELQLHQAALALTHARPIPLPREAWGVAHALTQAELDAAVESLRQWLVARAELRAEVVDALSTFLRFLRARSSQEAERIVRGKVLGLGPWSERILFSASGGVPQLQSNNFNIVGEGMLGYHDDAWGLAGGGGASVLEFESPDYVASTAKLFGNGDGWLSLALSDSTRLDLRATFDVVAYDSETVLVDEVTLSADETTLLVRGGALVGVRHQRPRFGIGAWLGGGGQVESYDQRTTVVLDDNPTQLSDTSALSGVLQARVRLQWGFWPDVLALRSSVDWKLYSMARLSEALDTSGAADEVLVQTDESATQLEAIGRGFIDVEAARVFDFVPGAGIGIDHYQLAVTGQETQVVTIPVYMLGVRRATF